MKKKHLPVLLLLSVLLIMSACSAPQHVRNRPQQLAVITGSYSEPTQYTRVHLNYATIYTCVATLAVCGDVMSHGQTQDAYDPETGNYDYTSALNT